MEIVLYRPEIPPNTGNVARLSICTASPMHIVGEPAFSLDEAAVRRAGIDYWHRVNLTLHADWPEFTRRVADRGSPPVLFFTRFARDTYSDYRFTGHELLVFGRETSGLPPEVLAFADSAPHHRVLRIPVAPDCRSLNLANAVSVVLYEGLRQLGFPNLSMEPPSGSR